MSFWCRHGKLAFFAGLTVLGIWGLVSGVVEENILALIPNSVRQEVELFGHSPLSQKLIVITQAQGDAQAAAIAKEVENSLINAGLIRPNEQTGEAVLPSVLSLLPGLFSPQMQVQTVQKISAPAVAARLAETYEDLFSFQSMFVFARLTQDPFNLTDLLFSRWSAIGGNVQKLTYDGGLLTTASGNVRAGLYTPVKNGTDISFARELAQFFTQLQPSLPPGVRVFFMGGLRYTLENVRLIEKDLIKITCVGVLCLTGVFVCFFRTRRALLVYLLPLLVLPPAAWVTQRLFGHISGIALGFGSVVVGLSVDYAIYVYFALLQTGTANAVTKIKKHLWCNFLTSGLCFIALLFSSIEVFKQIAVFALMALSLAFLIAGWVYPAYFTTTGVVTKEKKPLWEIAPLSFKGAVWACAGLLLFGGWGIYHVSFTTDLAALNSTAPTFAEEKQIAEQLFPARSGALLFALGETKQAALWQNERLSSEIPGGLPVSALFVSAQTRAENVKRWQEFWSPARQRDTRRLLQSEAEKYGFAASSFDPFWTWLQTTPQPAMDLASWYNPVLQIAAMRYAVVNVVPDTPLYAAVADGVNAVFVSVSQLQKKVAAQVKKEAVFVALLALVLNGLALGLLFRNVKETLLCFVPVVLGGCFLFGCLALFHIPVNLFGLIFLPLLIGLGLDYAIFQSMKYRAAQAHAGQLYPAQALAAAGLSTLAGFGVLAVAQHAVLFMMGMCALVGIGGAVLVSLLILPALWEHYL